MTLIASGGFLPTNNLETVLNTQTKMIVFSLLMLISFFSLFFLYNLLFYKKKGVKFIQEDIYAKVISLCEALNNQQNIGLVVGATNDDALIKVRNSTDLPFLIPGIGAQGGNLQSVLNINEKNMDTTLINVSRGIIFSGNKDHDSIRNFAKQYLNQLRGLNG